MTLHRNLAFLSLTLLVGAAVWRWRRPLARGGAALGLVGAIGLGGVGYLGGEIVYQHGLGISNERMGGIMRERGVGGPMMADSTGTATPPSADSTVGTDSLKPAPPGAKQPHGHAPGREH
jgi:hypothetical protein